MHLFHKWSKWEMYKQKMIHISLLGKDIKYVENWQRRHCLICGFVQEREI